MDMKWSLTLREENWLRKFENRVLRKILGPTGEELTLRSLTTYIYVVQHR
jgi:hypothetical protein